jgi:hypothetical protein
VHRFFSSQSFRDSIIHCAAVINGALSTPPETKVKGLRANMYVCNDSFRECTPLAATMELSIATGARQYREV